MEEISIENNESTNTLPLPAEDEDFVTKCNRLENLNQEIRNEFNIQRGKLKELFLQKELELNKLKTELDDLKSQICVAECKKENDYQLTQEEIRSLQQLLQDTMEESTMYKSDVKQLHLENSKLKQDIRDLKEEIQLDKHEPSSLAPVLHQVKTLTKKLVGDSSSSINFDSLDEPVRKANKYAQEDAEVLRSIVIPLEEEIKALKEKLRATDEELQIHRVTPKAVYTDISDIKTDAIHKSTSMEISCNSCIILEAKLQQCHEQINIQNNKIKNLNTQIADSKENLLKEAALRHDLESQWQEKREKYKQEIQSLTEQVKKNEKEFHNVQQQFSTIKEDIQKKLFLLTSDRERVDKHIEQLQIDNDFLSGQYLATSSELDNQEINLPNNIDELQELALQQKADLIQARLGYEFERNKGQNKQETIQTLQFELATLNREKSSAEQKVQAEIKSLNERLSDVMVKEHNHAVVCENFERKESELNKQISDLHVKIIELEESNKKLILTKNELKSKMKNLQDDLQTSETVQKDFVKLSQTLQMALENIRQADTEVRWQDDEHVTNCSQCNCLFTVTVRKLHCRHCGHIYCMTCLNKTIPSGPRKKPVKVCDICHTLLTPNTAPYFSKDLPQSPT